VLSLGANLVIGNDKQYDALINGFIYKLSFWQIVESSQLHLYSALHTPWCLLCLVRRVSLAEYILILRVYSHLLQMMFFMMASARPVSILLYCTWG